MRTALAVSALAIALGASAPRANEVAQHLTLDQGRVLAVHALQTGRPQLALQVSDALLAADSRDSVAWMLKAAAHADLRDHTAGRRAAVRAYRFTDDSGGKFQAAQLASRMAFNEGRPTLSQVWLRRTAIHAPDDAAKEKIAADYKVLRRINPWAFRFRSEVRPSNNVNNGSDSTLEIIDGVPFYGGRFGPRSVALSGVIGTLDLGASRRLHDSDTSLTTLSTRLYIQRVALSDSAKALAASLAAPSGTTVPRNSEFASTYGEFSLSHSFAVGPPQDKGSASLALTLGTSWYGGDKSYDVAKVSGARNWQLSAATGLSLDGLVEERFDARYSSQQATVLGLGVNLSHRLQGGDRVQLTFGLRDTDAGHANATYAAASLRLGYEFGQAIGPMRISTGLIMGYSDYPVFYGGPMGAPIPGGRRDESLYGDLNLFFEDYDYAGFAPMLRLRAGKKFSNHSRFETRDFSLSLGIESNF